MNTRLIALKVLAIATIGLALRVEAAPAPIVFDFEDGLQGWELHGAATRVQTQVLGGEWSIFGDGLVQGASISIEMDLTDFASISLEHFFIDGNEDRLSLSLNNEGLRTVFPSPFGVVQSGNPSVRAVDVSTRTGVWSVGILWNHSIIVVSPFPIEIPTPPPVVAFIDNITFHPVPEPGTLALLAVSLAALGIGRRRIV